MCRDSTSAKSRSFATTPPSHALTRGHRPHRPASGAARRAREALDRRLARYTRVDSSRSAPEIGRLRRERRRWSSAATARDVGGRRGGELGLRAAARNGRKAARPLAPLLHAEPRLGATARRRRAPARSRAARRTRARSAPPRAPLPRLRRALELALRTASARPPPPRPPPPPTRSSAAAIDDAAEAAHFLPTRGALRAEVLHCTTQLGGRSARCAARAGEPASSSIAAAAATNDGVAASAVGKKAGSPRSTQSRTHASDPWRRAPPPPPEALGGAGGRRRCCRSLGMPDAPLGAARARRGAQVPRPMK